MCLGTIASCAGAGGLFGLAAAVVVFFASLNGPGPLTWQIPVLALYAGFIGFCIALVFGVPVVIVLCVVPTEGSNVEEDEIRAFLRERLAAYKVPKRVLTFAADELSYTGNQKVQVDPLREAALARLRAEGTEIDGHRYTKSED